MLVILLEIIQILAFTISDLRLLHPAKSSTDVFLAGESTE